MKKENLRKHQKVSTYDENDYRQAGIMLSFSSSVVIQLVHNTNWYQANHLATPNPSLGVNSFLLLLLLYYY